LVLDAFGRLGGHYLAAKREPEGRPGRNPAPPADCRAVSDHPAINQTQHAVTAWRAIFASATLCSLRLIIDSTSRLIRFHREIASADDPSEVNSVWGIYREHLWK
jgi:hypothetical protein